MDPHVKRRYVPGQNVYYLYDDFFDRIECSTRDDLPAALPLFCTNAEVKCRSTDDAAKALVIRFIVMIFLRIFENSVLVFGFEMNLCHRRGHVFFVS